MKKAFLSLLLTVLTVHAYSQISFEKGYYITTSDQKVECLIKNMDWKNNPTEFEYKLSTNDKSEIATINTIKEFGIYNSSKYIREIVKIDKSSDDVTYMTEEKNPIFVEEELFLKVLIEGKASLYFYQFGNLKRYFYNMENSEIEQLVYKRYMIDRYKVGENNHFRQQLNNSFNCSSIKANKIENLNYKQRDLSKLFVEYNQCTESTTKDYVNSGKEFPINITLRPRFNSTELIVNNEIPNGFTIDFGRKSGFAFGVEAEYVFPFNKNKWSVSLEPTYQSYKNKKQESAPNISGRELYADIKYSSLEVPVTFRHYLFLNKNSKLFVNVSYIFDMEFNSTVELLRADNSVYETLTINTVNNFGFGIGYKYDDKYSIEMRYQTKRELLQTYGSWNTDFQTVSVIIGYTIF